MAKKQTLEEKVRSKIKKAGKDSNLLKIWYTDKKGAPSIRLTEPYEIRDGDYFGYCKNKNSIRRFNINKIEDARISKKKYDPRWDIKTGGMNMKNQEKVAAFFTEPNPHKVNSEKDQNEFIALGKKIDTGTKLTPSEKKRFNDLTMGSTKNVVRPEVIFGADGALTGLTLGALYSLARKKNLLKSIGVGTGIGALSGITTGRRVKENRDKIIKAYQEKVAACGASKVKKKKLKTKSAASTIDTLYKSAALEAKDAKDIAKAVAKIIGIGVLATGTGLAGMKSRDMLKEVDESRKKLINKHRNRMD